MFWSMYLCLYDGIVSLDIYGSKLEGGGGEGQVSPIITLGPSDPTRGSNGKLLHQSQ